MFSFPFRNQFSGKYIDFWYHHFTTEDCWYWYSDGRYEILGRKSRLLTCAKRIIEVPLYYIYPIWQCQWTTQSISCLLNCRHRINAMHYTAGRFIESVHDCSILVILFHSTSFSSCLSPMRSILLWHIWHTRNVQTTKCDPNMCAHQT